MDSARPGECTVKTTQHLLKRLRCCSETQKTPNRTYISQRLEARGLIRYNASSQPQISQCNHPAQSRGTKSLSLLIRIFLHNHDVQKPGHCSDRITHVHISTPLVASLSSEDNPRPDRVPPTFALIAGYPAQGSDKGENGR